MPLRSSNIAARLLVVALALCLVPPVRGQLMAQVPSEAGSGSWTDTAGREEDIDRLLARYDNTRSPGCAVGVLTDTGLAFARGYGMASLDHGLAITPRTVFRTGSVSKQFTAAVVTLLAREGAFSLDDGIRTYFPELPELYEPVTIAHLLHHTSGVRDYLELMAMLGVGDEATYTEDDMVALLAKQKGLNFPAGSAYRYSNSGFLLLSRLVFRTTGTTLRDQAQRLLFGPLGMTHTHFHDDHREIVPNRATGYGSAEDGRFYVDQTTLDIVGDGGVFTSIEDLSRWMENFWTLKVGDADWLAQMETRGVLNNGDTIDYALGLELGVQRGLRTVGHGGAFVGYRAATLRYPSERVALMALCNYGRANPSRILAGVGEIWLEDRMAPRAAVANEGMEPDASRPVETAPAPLQIGEMDAFIGEYFSEELDGVYRIFREEDALMVEMNGAMTVPLEAGGPDRFRADWLTLTFQREGGRVTGFQAGSGRAGGVTFVRR